MKDRFFNLKTTIMGIIVFFFGLLMLYLGKLDAISGITLIVLGWVFIAAKDTLLEGITVGLFKIDKK